ncbi:MAG: hypothetical protein J6Y20_10250 [Lachnospiraceae bacterium]|nr:hypothetical protein [Lachnospiraceae bacterium]MBP5462495.1 hypothetical protein [Lachnospiraceae bacterium]
MGLMNIFGNQREQLEQLKNDPVSMAEKAGYKLPDGIANDPKAMVMHLIQTGQVSSPMLQQIAPMLQRINGR